MTPLALLLAAAPALADAPPPRGLADGVSVAYHGDLLAHPGISARLDRSLSQRWSLEVEVGGYWHPRNLAAAFLRAGPAWRWTSASGRSWGATLHAGHTRGLYAAPTYAVEGGEVSRGPAGDGWWTLTPGLERAGPLPSLERLDGWFVRPQLGLRAPTFYGAGLDLAVQVGARF